MRLNDDFSLPAFLTPDRHRWVDSPQTGVSRVMLDRVGGEVARATSLVRYAAGSRFPAHRHPGGEEILVLDGVFSDETGHYPAGCYLRNPPGSTHAPASAPGCLLFVKLLQMSPDEATHTRVDTREPARWTREGDRQVCPLFRDAQEDVVLQHLAPGAALALAADRRVELLVIEGALVGAEGDCPRGSWLRLPPGERALLQAGGEGARVYVKTGHVPAAEPAA